MTATAVPAKPAGGAAAAGAVAAPARAGLVLGTLIMVAAVANLPLAMANVALPSIGDYFDASQTQLNLVAVAYSLGLACSVLWLGALGDRYGRKLMAVLGATLAMPAVGISGFVPTIQVLFFGRIFGGSASGPLHDPGRAALGQARRGARLALYAVGPGIGAGRTRGLLMYFWVLFPSLLASAAATVLFVLLSGHFFETLYRFPAYAPRVVDMFYATPLGLIGAVVGLLFMFSLRRLQRLAEPLQAHVVVRGLLGGLGIGLIGALLPLTLFSGESETADLIIHAAAIGVLMLIVLGLAKLLATSLLLATGWKGGYIFPIMFASAALSLAVNLVFPGIPVAVTVAATMAGALVAALKAPLFAALFTMVLVQKETAAVNAVAVVASALLTALVALRAARRAADQAQPIPETD
jgi:MFS family permease